MTASLLLLLIVVAILAQLCLGVGVAVWRRRRQALIPPVGIDRPATSAGSWQGLRPFRVVQREFEDAGLAQCSFLLEPVDKLMLSPFLPGQFVTLALAVSPDRNVVRCYSLSDQPDPERYRITVKRVPDGEASGYLHAAVQVGDILQLRAPAGPFVLDPDQSVPAVLVAGGIGITPMMSMITWSLRHQPQRRLRLYYGVRCGADHAFRATLAELAATHPALTVTCVYSHPAPGDVVGRDFDRSGHVDLELLRATLPHGRHQFYVCGPPPMMAALVPGLREWGVRQDDIKHEAFGPASLPPAAGQVESQRAGAGAPLEIAFRRSGRTVLWTGQDANLLDFAERHGIAIESGCRAGSCGSCETNLLSGSVLTQGEPAFEVAPGACLMCVAKPTTALQLEA
jgi:ferredoxin-NADP reductase